MVRHRPNWGISKLEVPITSSFILPDSRCCHLGLPGDITQTGKLVVQESECYNI